MLAPDAASCGAKEQVEPGVDGGRDGAVMPVAARAPSCHNLHCPSPTFLPPRCVHRAFALHSPELRTPLLRRARQRSPGPSWWR